MNKVHRKTFRVLGLYLIGIIVAFWFSSIQIEARPVNQISIHDPSITKGENGKYYIYGTHLGSAVSDDLINWETMSIEGITRQNCATVLAEPFSWIPSGSRTYNSHWAPDVIYNKTTQKYHYYACMSAFGTANSVIYFATSDSPEGPFTYQKSILYTGFNANSSASSTLSYTKTNIPTLISEGRITGFRSNWASTSAYNGSAGNYPNAIDPTVFYDKEDRMWMTYGSWFGGIYILEIDPATGEPIYPGVDDEENGVDRYFGKMLLTARNTGDVVNNSGEGPYIIYDPVSDYYYLCNTYGELAVDKGYNLRIFRSENPDGPYVDASGVSGLSTGNKGTKLLGNYKFPSNAKAMLSGGHNSLLIDDDDKIYQVYHSRFNPDSNHTVQIHQAIRNEDGWPCTAPYLYQGESVSATGYSMKEMVGTYDYINHGAKTTPTMNYTTPSEISINLDGSISGAVTGYWSYKVGTPYVNMYINGISYKGAFLKQKDEADNPQEVMVFTLIGENNCSAWGSKTSDEPLAPSTIADDPDIITASTDEPMTVGAANLATAYRGDYSKYIKVSGDFEVSLSFTNKSNSVEAYHNWCLVLSNAVKREEPDYAEFYLLKANATGFSKNDSSMQDITWEGNPVSYDTSWGTDWTTFKDMMKNANVEMTISREGDIFTINARINGAATYQATFQSQDAPAQLYLALTMERSQLVINQVDVFSDALPELPKILLQSIKLSGGKTALQVGESTSFDALILPENASNKRLLWSANNNSVGVDATGKVTAKQAGRVILKARAADGSGTEGTIVVNVTDTAKPPTPTPTLKPSIPATSKLTVTSPGYTLQKKRLYLRLNKSATLKATVAPKAAQQGVSYKASNKNVTIKGGKITAKKVGKTKVTIKTNDGKKVVITVHVVKKAKKNKALKVKKSSITLAKKGAKKTITATVSAKTTELVKYKSLNPKIAKVNKYGVITGKAKGKTTIVVTCGNKKKNVKVSVKK